MSPRPIDLKVVEDRLTHLDQQIRGMKKLPSSSIEAFKADWRNPHTAETLIRHALEALLDATRHLLSRHYGLGALEYRETARLAAEKGLVRDEPLQALFQEMAGYRNRLTHHYAELTVDELYGIVRNHVDDMAGVAQELRDAAERLIQAEKSQPKRRE